MVTLMGYYVLFGGRHRRKRRRLAEELREAQRQVGLWTFVCCLVGAPVYCDVYMLSMNLMVHMRQ